MRLFLPLGIPDTIPFAILNLIRISSKELHPRKSHRSLIQCYSRSGFQSAESFTGKALTYSLSLPSCLLRESRAFKQVDPLLYDNLVYVRESSFFHVLTLKGMVYRCAIERKEKVVRSSASLFIPCKLRKVYDQAVRF